MLLVNGKELDYREDITVKELLNELENNNKFSYMSNFVGTVFINDVLVHPKQYDKTKINDCDVIRIIPLIYGG